MKEIRNKTSLPIRIPLPGGKVLHLGPGKIAQVADKAVEHAGLLKLIEADSIEVMGEGERTDGVAGSTTAAAQTQAGGKSPFRRRSGER